MFEESYIKERYHNWEKIPLKYDFKQIYYLLSIMYVFATLFDLCLTYLTSKFLPEVFVEYEFSHVIKMSYTGDAFYSFLAVVLFMLPLILVLVFSLLNKRKYGQYTNGVRLLLAVLYYGSFMHMFGGFTNFFALIMT